MMTDKEKELALIFAGWSRSNATGRWYQKSENYPTFNSYPLNIAFMKATENPDFDIFKNDYKKMKLVWPLKTNNL
jgi:hypothetical protein